MLKYFVLLVSLLFQGTALADPPMLETTGFVYGTAFSDSNWYPNRGVAAVNFDVFDDSTTWAVRAQVSTYPNQPIRRFVGEWATHIGDSSSVVTQVGRFARLDSFANGITDNPATYGTAMLPNEGYSYRMFNGAFSLLDGANVIASSATNIGLFRARVGYGIIDVPSNRDLVWETWKADIPALRMPARRGSYDFGLHYESQGLHLYTSRNMYTFDVVLTDPTSAAGRFVVSNFSNADYYVSKVGARYDTQNYYAQLELKVDHAEGYSPLAKGEQAGGESEGYALLAGYHVLPWATLYVGKSYGQNVLKRSVTQEVYYGITLEDGPHTLSIEHHSGSGTAWRRYDAPVVKAPNIPTWDSWIASYTFRF